MANGTDKRHIMVRGRPAYPPLIPVGPCFEGDAFALVDIFNRVNDGTYVPTEDGAAERRLGRQLARMGDMTGLRLLEISAGQGNKDARVDVIRLTLDGYETGLNPEDAVAEIESLAKDRVPYAMGFASMMYRDGIGVPESNTKALGMAREAAAAGDPLGMSVLGYMLLHGLGIREDPERGVEWIRRAAEAGCPEAMGMLGLMYMAGDGVPADEEQAVHWSGRAAEACDTAGLMCMGFRLTYGIGVDRDESKAAEYLTIAAFLGDPICMTMSGNAYRDGRGVQRSLGMARDYYMKALDTGYAAAGEELDRMYRAALGDRAEELGIPEATEEELEGACIPHPCRGGEDGVLDVKV